ncbi:MAG: Wzz/FepE/Etk N-terminal domain-containing protein [Verrucomicrobiales bacterium]
MDLSRLVTVVRKRLWLAAVVALVFVALAATYAFLAPEVYESSAVIYVGPNSDGAVFEGMRGAKKASWETLDALKSMAEGIANGTVILRVADRLDLRNDPDFLEPREGGYDDSEIVEIVGKTVDAELRRGTRLIDVAVKGHSPERAQKMTAAFIEEFQALIREQNAEAAAKTRQTLLDEAEKQLERVNEVEERLQGFRLKHTDVPLDEDNDIVAAKLEDLDKALSLANNEVLVKRAQFEQYKSIPEDEIARVLEVGDYDKQDHIQKLLLARNQKRAEFGKIKQQFQPVHNTYQAYKADLDGLEEEVRLVAKSVGESIENAYRRAVDHEAKLRETVQAQKRTLIEVDGVKKEFRTLKRTVDAAYSTYDRLLDRINDTNATNSVDETGVRVFSEPLIPSKPVAPRKKLILAVSGVFGSMCGLALVVGMGLLDRTLNSRKQVESTLGLAVLAEVPKAFEKEWDLKDSLFVTRDPGSVVSESLRSLRTSLSAYTPRSVMITSASPGEGKSFCAGNLAVLQANMGYRTLLIDADFCKPRMAEIFIDPMKGEAKEGAIATQNVCRETIYKDLYLLSCGSLTSDSVEPMNSEIFARMLHESYTSFDCVIIDTSPLNIVSDGLAYSRHADSVVLVVKAGMTQADDAKQAMRELQRMRAPLVGCVLNGSSEVNVSRKNYVQGTARSLPSSGTPLAPLGTST